jgi:hypothetical protein
VSRLSGPEATTLSERLETSTCWWLITFTCASSAFWCPRTDQLFDVAAVPALTVERQPERVVLTVGSDADLGCSQGCGVVASATDDAGEPS